MPTRPSPNEIITYINGTPVLLGTLTCTTTKNNHDTAVPFNDTTVALTGKVLLLQPDATCYVLPVTANDGTVTTANGVKLAADEKVIIGMASSYGFLAAVSASGTTNIKVWELK